MIAKFALISCGILVNADVANWTVEEAIKNLTGMTLDSIEFENNFVEVAGKSTYRKYVIDSSNEVISKNQAAWDQIKESARGLPGSEWLFANKDIQTIKIWANTGEEFESYWHIHPLSSSKVRTVIVGNKAKHMDFSSEQSATRKPNDHMEDGWNPKEFQSNYLPVTLPAQITHRSVNPKGTWSVSFLPKLTPAEKCGYPDYVRGSQTKKVSYGGYAWKIKSGRWASGAPQMCCGHAWKLDRKCMSKQDKCEFPWNDHCEFMGGFIVKYQGKSYKARWNTGKLPTGHTWTEATECTNLHTATSAPQKKVQSVSRSHGSQLSNLVASEQSPMQKKECKHPAYVPGKTYYGGNKVTFNGLVFKARNWVRNEPTVCCGRGWSIVTSCMTTQQRCNFEYPKCEVMRKFIVKYNGKSYQSKYPTAQLPGSSAWTLAKICK